MKLMNERTRTGRLGIAAAALAALAGITLSRAAHAAGMGGAGVALQQAPAAQPATTTITAVKVGTLHVGNGTVIENGVVLIDGGKITAVGAGLAIPVGAGVIDLPKGSITPGLIDANALVESQDMISRRQGRPSALALMFHGRHNPEEQCFICSGQAPCALANIHETLEPGQICPCCAYPSYKDVESLVSGVETTGWSQTEASSEVVPHTRVMDAVNLRSPDFDRLVRGGVTTVFVSPDSSAVIGPRGAVVRTAGPMRDRVEQAEAAVKGVMGTDAFNIGMGNASPFRGFVTVRTRRPNTRMGVAWVFRKAFYDAARWSEGVQPTGADTPPADALPVLKDILAGKIPLRIQARQQSDILTALRLSAEHKLKFTLLEGTEAYKCLAELKATRTPVVFGPISVVPSGPRLETGESEGARLTTLRELLDAGVETALSAQDLREEDGLARQAMYAMRAGLTLQEAITAVTLTPAKLVGISDKAGSIESGKRADLVVWTGEPFDSTSRPVVVIVGGKSVFDGREKKPAAH